MLSYESIFLRHHRPVSYLNGTLELPAARRRTPLVFPSPVLHKDVRRPRPLSMSSVNNIPRYTPPSPTPHRRLITTATSDIKPPHMMSSLNTTSRHVLPAKTVSSRLDRVPKCSSDNYRLSTTLPDRHLRRWEVPLCTTDELLDIIMEPSGYYELPTDPWNEVYPNIYLSDAPTALCTSVLKRIGITHVLNAAQGKEKGCGQVNTTPGFYSQSGIKFLGVPAFDNIVFKLYPYFEEAAQFVEDALQSNGKVLVHCRAGISRSATLVLAFLMLKRGLTAQEAVKTVRKNRAIIPNDGFLQQLCDLNDRLKRKSRL